MKIADQINYNMFESVKDSIKKTFKVEDKDFEKAKESHCVTSIAKTKEGYVGFSHRAACEFKVGDMLFDQEWTGDDLTEEELDKVKFVERGSVKIKTLEQARQAAINFAEYVS